VFLFSICLSSIGTFYCEPSSRKYRHGLYLLSKNSRSRWANKLLDLKMHRSSSISEKLIAPCGMNCAVCSRYLSYVNNLKRSQCVGCRLRIEQCAYLFGKCSGINHAARGNAAFCFECSYYPCKQINRMDDRYRKNYKMSIKDNLEHIKQRGIGEFIEEQYRKYHCSKCGGLISIHNGKCFTCDTITKLVVKDVLPKYTA
jgi:hypothetical protein